ncbi:Ger(x)C family spore germination protein [Oceanirhabdus sp. W0125-5]|uniref:Ger(x)C family spore germination protein n=1 Tax=Oceanirhabdus sp. W0125-5 TaxID=2999116 RepID=UPI0022F31744|nr:Ger(x)C family spore germination protein [Oceanirhabdus sp. W0125-5]WBW99420.1 Ger(x)C family spore germination protein [Oceanirhabdus sp. W0125-5]
MKKRIKVWLIVAVVICNCFISSSCWDYTEFNNVIPVAGIAIDKDEHTGEYLLTLEVIQPTEDGNSIQSVVLEGRGKTVHGCFRETITTTGSMVSTRHAALYVIDKKIAEEGIIPVIDLVDRDVDVRSDMLVFVCEEKNAGDVFKKTKDLEEIISYQIVKTVQSQELSGRFLSTKLYEFVDELTREGISPTITNIYVGHTANDIVAKTKGTHVFKGDKVVGLLDGEETLYLTFIKGNEKLKTVFPISLSDETNVSLEMVGFSKKIKPYLVNDEINFDIKIDVNVLVSEIGGGEEDYLSKPGRYEIKRTAEKLLERNINKLIYKAQNDLKSDIFGFGEILKKKQPEYWKKTKEKWDAEFKLAKVNVDCEVHIRGSALKKNTIKVGK